MRYYTYSNKKALIFFYNMSKQAKLYLTDLYYHPNSSYYDQGNRILNYNRRLLPLLRED